MRNRIAPVITIDLRSGRFWGGRAPPKSGTFDLAIHGNIKGMKSHMEGGVKIGGKKGSIFNGNLHLMFGSEYIVGATALRVLAFGYFIFSLFSLASSLLQSYGRTGIVMKCSFVGAGANIILNFLLIPVYGVNGAAIATTVSLVLLGILYFLFIYRIKKIQPIKLSYAKPLFASLISILIVYAITKYVISVSLFSLAGMFFIFLTLYFFLLLIFKSFEEEDLMIMRAMDDKLGIKSDWMRNIFKRFL